MKSRLRWALTVLLLGGITVSSISLATHYSKDKSEFCDLSNSFNCDMVNRGPYATFAATAPIAFPPDPSQPPESWLERVGDAFAAHVMQPLNDLAMRMGIRVPIAGIGLAGYLLLLALTWVGWRNRAVAVAQFTLSALALIFSPYLTYVEKYLIAYWCILCLSSLLVIFAVTVLSAARAWRRPEAPRPLPSSQAGAVTM